MPRYKVLGACVCERNHANLHTERLVAASAQEAQAVFKGLVTQHNKCTTCGGKMQLGKLLGTEEVPMHPLYVVYDTSVTVVNGLKLDGWKKELHSTHPRA